VSVTVAPVAPVLPIDPESLRRSLRGFGAPEVEVRETRGAWVLLAGGLAYKLRKPLCSDDTDLRRPAARRAACAEEVAAATALAAGLHHELRGVAPGPSDPELVAPDDPRAVDWLVVSRRFDEAQTLAARIADGRVPPDAALRVGERLARFHAAAARCTGEPTTRAVVTADLEVLAGLAGPGAVAALRRFAEAFLDGWEPVLHGRAAAGRVVDGHGDLRTGHVLLEGDDVLVVGRPERSGRRAVDVADDLAFLCMDLRRLGGGALVAPLLAGYVAAGGERPPRELLAFFGAHRAAARAAVALLRASQPAGGHADREEARRLLTVAAHAAARARGENVIVVGGPPAVGKSTVCAALAAATGLPVLRPDEVREELGAGTDLGARAAVHAELGRRAAAHPSCIVDAAFGEPMLRRAFLAELDRDHRRRLFAVECHAPPAVLQRRARARGPGTSSRTRADAEVAARLATAYTPFDELAPGDRLRLDAGGDPQAAADTVLGWLDAHLAAGRLV